MYFYMEIFQPLDINLFSKSNSSLCSLVLTVHKSSLLSSPLSFAWHWLSTDTVRGTDNSTKIDTIISTGTGTDSDTNYNTDTDINIDIDRGTVLIL